MDFRSLNRRELQALCKMNNIRANITNVAMADALQALDLVEGIEDILKPSESEAAISSVELPQKSDLTSQSVSSTGRRTAQRKTVKNETETSQTLTRTHKSSRRMLAGDVDNEAVETPVVRTVGRRAAAKEKQDVHETPGAMMTSQKREAKDKSSTSQVYSIRRRSARLAAKRLKESSKQDNERSEPIIFDNFSEGLGGNSERCSLHFEDEVEKAGIDLKKASNEGLGMKKAKEGGTDLSAISFETENLNLLNKELKVDMPKSSEELATSDNTNAIIENNVDMLLPEKLGEVEESNDDKAMKLDSSMDIEPANFVLAENSENNGLGHGKESHCNECVNVPDSYDIEVGLQDPHVLPVAPKSSLQLDQEVVYSDMVPKQMDESNEPNATCEAGDADFTLDVYSKSIGLSSEKESHSDDCVNLPDLYDGGVGTDSSSQPGQVIVSDGMILPKQFKEPRTKQICVSEVEDADDMGLSKQLFALNINRCEVEDEPDTEEISDLVDDNADHQCRGQEEVVDDDLVVSKQLDDEDETNAKEISYTGENAAEANSKTVGEGQLGEFTSCVDEAKAEGISNSEDEDTTQASSEVSDGELSLDELRGDENGTKAKGISNSEDEDTTQARSEASDGELPLDELRGDENGAKAKGISNSEDEDTTQASSEASDGELPLDELRGDENGLKAKGISNSDDEDTTQASSEASDGELSLDELRGVSNGPKAKGISHYEGSTEGSYEGSDGELSQEEYSEDDDAIETGSEYDDATEAGSEDEDATEPGSEGLDGERSLEKFTGDEKDATKSRSESSERKESLIEFAGDSESFELLRDVSEANMDAIGDKKPVQEYMQNVVEAPFESSVPQVDLIGGTPLSPLAFEHKQIPSGSAETNVGRPIQMIFSTPMKKSSSKTPTKTPITKMSAGLKCVSDDKENVDNSGRKLFRLNNKLKLEKHHEDCSPREITKSNANTKESTRPALQQLP